MIKSLPWKVYSPSAGKEIVRLLWNKKVHFHIFKSPSLVPTPSRMSLVCIFTRDFYRIHFDIIVSFVSPI
jgi:hypothetical protein